MGSRHGWLCAAALVLVGVPVHADWVVTKDGGKFEIRGSWEIKGKLVVFTTTDGTLSSLRADHIDFDASKQATAEAAKAAAVSSAPAPAKATEPQPKKRASWVLTDKDFKKASPADAGDKDAADKGAGAAAKDTKEAAPAAAGGLQVVSWDRVAPPDPITSKGVQIIGSVQNSGPDLLTDLTVTANFFDDQGTLLGKIPVSINAARLQPRETASFTATAPGVFSFTSIKFEVHASGFKVRNPVPGATDKNSTAKSGDAQSAAPPPSH